MSDDDIVAIGLGILFLVLRVYLGFHVYTNILTPIHAHAGTT